MCSVEGGSVGDDGTRFALVVPLVSAGEGGERCCCDCSSESCGCRGGWSWWLKLGLGFHV